MAEHIAFQDHSGAVHLHPATHSRRLELGDALLKSDLEARPRRLQPVRLHFHPRRQSQLNLRALSLTSCGYLNTLVSAGRCKFKVLCAYLIAADEERNRPRSARAAEAPTGSPIEGIMINTTSRTAVNTFRHVTAPSTIRTKGPRSVTSKLCEA